ncbi:hypothetical protein DE146DRAFT_624068 [Phaeosphaeria sp. MPI-PUGE-AT-0046c]|nr:hypothetical protein DE146DRAFT_624068 [Phaeosphaeria sp. MPI-PUGE-AT-0046c]
MSNSTRDSTTTAETSVPVDLILSIWCIPTLLPPSLPLSLTPSPAMLTALLGLANLTPNQPERAWSLISTYFYARIREASYTGRRSGGMYAVVEEEDVIKAYESVRRMSVGMEMEGGVRRNSSESSISKAETGKRRCSINDKTLSKNIETDVAAKRQKTVAEVSENEKQGNELPPLPAILDMPPHPERKVELPPIYTLVEEEDTISLDTLLEAARGAMHETNWRRREWEQADKRAALARAKFEEARRLAGKLRTEVRRVQEERDRHMQ